MFKFNFSNSDENLNKSDEVKTETKVESVKESVKIDVTPDQYKEIAENLTNSHLNVFISRRVLFSSK